jgi:hypothetical protein
MAAGFKRNGSALNTKEPDSAITSRCDPRTETETVTWKNRILLLNGSIIIAENQNKFEQEKKADRATARVDRDRGKSQNWNLSTLLDILALVTRQ